MRYYGLDLPQEWETIGARRLAVLVRGLPFDSAVWWEENRWTQQDELLAELLEMTDIASRRVVAALGGTIKGKPLEIERPVLERPAQPQKKKITTDTAEIAAWFRAHN